MNANSTSLGRYQTPRHPKPIAPSAFYAVDSLTLRPGNSFLRHSHVVTAQRGGKQTSLLRNGIACPTAMNQDHATRRNTISSNSPTLIHSRSLQQRRPFPGQYSIGRVGQNSIGADNTGTREGTGGGHP